MKRPIHLKCDRGNCSRSRRQSGLGLSSGEIGNIA